jgi:hypothetical protein
MYDSITLPPSIITNKNNAVIAIDQKYPITSLFFLLILFLRMVKAKLTEHTHKTIKTGMYTKFCGRMDARDSKRPPLLNESFKNATVIPIQNPRKADISGTIKTPA